MSAPAAHHRVAALDVGGTVMKGALIEGDGTMAATYRWSTPRGEGHDTVVAAVLDAVDELVTEDPTIGAVGVVVPGLVDDHAGLALHSENIGWRNVAFRDLVAERTGLPVGFGHDVRAGGVAERTLGAARGADNVLFMPIGTGISGAMYIDGRLAANKFAGEIGHLDVGSGQLCACGSTGCLETVSSAAAIATRYNQEAGASVTGSREVLHLKDAGDQVAQRIWDDAVLGLARALTSYISLLAPERVVVGGGLSAAGDSLLNPLRHQLQTQLVWQPHPDIVAAALGDNAACIGAGLLAREAARLDQIPSHNAPNEGLHP